MNYTVGNIVFNGSQMMDKLQDRPEGKGCNHVVATVDECDGVVMLVRSDEADIWQKSIDEWFNYCPRCGVRLNRGKVNV